MPKILTIQNTLFMEKATPRATLEDLATRSGVSIATVSRVINASGPVSDDAEQRVKQAMKELSFEPKQKRRKTRATSPLLACIIPEFMNPANTIIITGIQDEAEKLGAHIMIVPVSEKTGSIHSNLNFLRQVPIDGVILAHVGVQAKEVLEACKSPNLPMVVLRKDVPTYHAVRIDVDRENGMYQGAKLLIGLNHKDIGYLCGTSDSERAYSKLRGIQRAFHEAGLTLKPELQRVCLRRLTTAFVWRPISLI